MLRFDDPQGSPGWHKARIGHVTASGLDNILTPKALQASKASEKYLHQLVAEHALGRSLDEAESVYMERGLVMEGEAAAWYEMEKDTETEIVGFLLTDDERLGCSPDRLVGADGGLEIKCPGAIAHVGYFLDPTTLVAEYRGQVQGCLAVTGRKWWDLLSYNPEIPSVLVRVLPDPAYQAALARELPAFHARLAAAKEKVGAMLETARDANPFL